MSSPERKRRQAHPNSDVEATLQAVYGDGLTQIRTYSEAADYLSISKSTLASRLRRANLSTLADVPYDNFLPSNFDAEHKDDREHLMLRALAQESAGVHIGERRVKELARFKEKSERLVVVYDPEYGYYWRKRESRDEDFWVVQEG